MIENHLQLYDMYSHMYNIRTMQLSDALRTISEEAKFIISDYYMHLKKNSVNWDKVEKMVDEPNEKTRKNKR